MRVNLSTNAEVADYWANQRQHEGKASNFFFREDRLFSWNDKFCVARHIKPGIVAITTFSSRSQSTNQHIHLARRETAHLKTVECYDPGAYAWKNRDHTITLIKAALDDAVLPRIRQPRRDASNSRAEYLAKQFNEYLAALPENERGPCQPFPETAQKLRDHFVVQHVMQRLES